MSTASVGELEEIGLTLEEGTNVDVCIGEGVGGLTLEEDLWGGEDVGVTAVGLALEEGTKED